MPLKTPSWWQSDSWQSRLLIPVSWIYGWIHRLKYTLTKPYNSPLPILCVGGVVAGGSGKTPVLHALLALIQEEEFFINPVILTRGYGGNLKGPTLVDPYFHTVKDVGDEALLHAAKASTIVSRDRKLGVRLAEAMGADIILMDDGLQNNSLHKNASLLVMNADQNIGNGRLIPAGPLREPLPEAMNKVNGVVATGGSLPVSCNKPVWHAHLETISTLDPSKKYIGFAGLGHPDKFRKTLLDAGCHLLDFKSYPDHYPYAAKDMEYLSSIDKNAILVTTEKDYVRIPHHYQNGIEVLKIRMVFAEKNPVSALLKDLKDA